MLTEVRSGSRKNVIHSFSRLYSILCHLPALIKSLNLSLHLFQKVNLLSIDLPLFSEKFLHSCEIMLALSE
jgi:hypothetical protein